MKIWVDDERTAPGGYVHCRSVNEAIEKIIACEKFNKKYRQFTSAGVDEEHEIELIDLDHDAGVYAKDGGDYIKILDWLEATGRNYPIAIHTMNSVGRMNMMAIVEKNGWKLVRSGI